jgi:signal transduction histidine kinase/ActR/RegA family two-component response regulator
MPLTTKPLPQPATPLRGPRRYLLAVAIVGAASLLRQMVDPLVHDQIPYFIYVGAVVPATWFCGVGAGIVGTMLAAFLGNYLFVRPRYDAVPQPEDWIAIALFSAVAFGLVWQVGRWRRAERGLYARAQRMQEQARRMRQQAEELGRLNAEAERTNRAKDEFLATLSHELRTPINTVVGWAYMLSQSRLSPSQVVGASEAILRNSQLQMRLIDDLLDVSRIISGKLTLNLETVNLAEIARQVLDTVQPAAAAKDIELRTSLSPDTTLEGDPDRLRQVVWNLLSNAVKFTPKRGWVDVRAEKRESQIRLTVSDSGAGVEREFLPHLFERFTQADSSRTRHHGGLGLGLAIVRHIAELHGGTVSAASEGRNKGASFTISLPIRPVSDPVGTVDGRDGMRDGAALPVGADTLRDLRVLVVDDEADARMLVEAVLRRYGADVHTADSAEKAFQDVQRWHADVLVADIGMPEEDGYSLIRRVRALPAGDGGSTPAVALTAYAQNEDRQHAFAAGFQEHVAKPVRPERLAQVVARLGGHSRGLRTGF